MAWYQTNIGSSGGTPTFTTFNTDASLTVTGLTIGKKYLCTLALTSGLSITGANILYQAKSTGLIGSRYLFTVLVEATSNSMTISGTSVTSAKVITLIE